MKTYPTYNTQGEQVNVSILQDNHEGESLESPEHAAKRTKQLFRGYNLLSSLPIPRYTKNLTPQDLRVTPHEWKARAGLMYGHDSPTWKDAAEIMYQKISEQQYEIERLRESIPDPDDAALTELKRGPSIDEWKADQRTEALCRQMDEVEARLAESIAAGADTLIERDRARDAHLTLQHQNERLCRVFRTMTREIEMLIGNEIPYKEHTPHPVYMQILKLWDNLARLNNSPETEAIAHEA